MRSIVLSGPMGSGKSTVGPSLAARLGLPFVDLDTVIAERAERPIPVLWKEEGESGFRTRERAIARELLDEAAKSPRVIALGGGTLTDRSLRHRALGECVVITLTAEAKTLLERVGDASGRPLLAGGAPSEKLEEILENRRAIYAECHLRITTDGLEVSSIVDAILSVHSRDPMVVPLGERSYTIDFVNHAPSRLTDAIASLAPSSLVAVTDANVRRKRGHMLEAALSPLAFDRAEVVLAAGEQHKNLTSVSAIWDAVLGHGIDRQGILLAFGGGVVGDMTGFAASTLLRGLRVVQVPTTLLAMVDASVGGKTGFDHATGKNLIGSFHQPSAVVIDLDHLTTQSGREKRAGLAEVVKMALSADGALFDYLEENASALLEWRPDILHEVIRRAVDIKVRIVRDDEREGARRAILNLGHTLGHAIEAHGGFSKHLHGEAVAMGLMAELEATRRLGLTPDGLVARTRSLLEVLGLPTEVPQGELHASFRWVSSDKKRVGHAVSLPVVTAVGAAEVRRMDLRVLAKACDVTA